MTAIGRRFHFAIWFFSEPVEDLIVKSRSSATLAREEAECRRGFWNKHHRNRATSSGPLNIRGLQRNPRIGGRVSRGKTV